MALVAMTDAWGGLGRLYASLGGKLSQAVVHVTSTCGLCFWLDKGIIHVT